MQCSIPSLPISFFLTECRQKGSCVHHIGWEDAMRTTRLYSETGPALVTHLKYIVSYKPPIIIDYFRVLDHLYPDQTILVLGMLFRHRKTSSHCNEEIERGLNFELKPLKLWRNNVLHKLQASVSDRNLKKKIAVFPCLSTQLLSEKSFQCNR